MRPGTCVATLLLAVLGIACSGVRTHYDFDPSVDFSTWQTYAWYPSESAPTGDPLLDSPLLHGRIEAALDRALGERGYARVEDRTPDFFLNYHLSTEERLDVRTMNRGYVGGPRGVGWGGVGWGGVGWTETYVDQYEEGTLVIDFVDASQRRLAWRGSGTRRLTRSPTPDDTTKRVNEAVDEILGQFPPK